jgi:hypothetical protein
MRKRRKPYILNRVLAGIKAGKGLQTVILIWQTVAGALFPWGSGEQIWTPKTPNPRVTLETDHLLMEMRPIGQD